jgi:hypothetical protein
VVAYIIAARTHAASERVEDRLITIGEILSYTKARAE